MPHQVHHPTRPTAVASAYTPSPAHGPAPCHTMAGRRPQPYRVHATTFPGTRRDGPEGPDGRRERPEPRRPAATARRPPRAGRGRPGGAPRPAGTAPGDRPARVHRAYHSHVALHTLDHVWRVNTPNPARVWVPHFADGHRLLAGRSIRVHHTLPKWIEGRPPFRGSPATASCCTAERPHAAPARGGRLRGACHRPPASEAPAAPGRPRPSADADGGAAHGAARPAQGIGRHADALAPGGGAHE